MLSGAVRMSEAEHKEAEQSAPAVDIAELVQTLYDAANDSHSSVDRLQELLLCIRSSLLSSPSTLTAFLSQHYGPFSLYLLGRFSVEWLSKLDTSSRDVCFYFYFSSAFPASRVLLAIAAALRSPAGEPTASAAILSASVALHVLDGLMERRGMAELLNQLDSASSTVGSSGSTSRKPANTLLPPSATACLDSVASLPDLIANRLQSSTPSSLRAGPFITATLQQLPPSPLPTASLAYLVSKLSRLGHARVVFSCLLPPVFVELAVDERKDESDEWKQPTGGSACATALAAVLLAVNSAALEGVLDALLWQLGQYVERETYSQQHVNKVLYALLALALLPSSTALSSSTKEAPNGTLIRFLLTNKFLLSRPVSHTASSLILSLLFRSSYPPLSAADPCQPFNPLFDETLTAVARLWSSASFLHHATPALQHSLSSALRHAFSLLLQYQHTYLLTTSAQYRKHVSSATHSASDETQLLGPFSSHLALLAVMEGVQLRMSEMDEKRRKEGMRVAVDMSRLMDPTHVLNFDTEDDDTEEKEEDERKLKAEAERQQRHEQHRQQALTTGSTATALSAKSMPVYDLSEDTSDLRKVPLPRYLRDALELLRKQEERENVEAALEQLDTLIRGRPFDLPDVAADLVAMLQQVATTVFCENKVLDAKRRAALVSVAVECPETAALLLFRSFYGQSLTLMGKVEVLEVLVAAAEELSGKTTNRQNRQSQAPQTKSKTHSSITAFKSLLIPSPAQASPSSAPIPPSATSSTPSTALTRAQHDEVINQRVASRTRRWGTARQPAETFVNRFATVAHLFFFPLVGSLHVSGGWGAQPVVQSEPLLLSHVLNTLSVLVILACPAAHSLDAMTAQLLALLLTTRFHSNVTVRHMTLLSLLRVLLVLSTTQLIPTHGAVLRELRVWVSGAVSDEADDECRQLAAMCAGEMARVMQGLGEWELDEERRASATRGLELVVPGSASLTSPSSVRGSSMIKFM